MRSAELAKKLTAAGWWPERWGKGDHQLWRNAAGERFLLPVRTGRKKVGRPTIAHLRTIMRRTGGPT